MDSVDKESLDIAIIEPQNKSVVYESPRVIELGEAVKLTKYSSAGPYNDGSSESGRSWKS